MYASSFGRLAAATIAAATIAAGCNCERTQTSRSYGEIGVVHLDENGAAITSRDAEYDFGAVQMGDRVEKKLVVKNLGTGTLTLLSMERVEGDNVTLGTEAMENAAFEVRFVPDTTVGSSEAAEFVMAFTPPEGEDPGHAHSVKLVLSAGGTREGENTATIVLRGTATAGACELPSTIDFGKVAVGSSGTQSLTFTNAGQNPTAAFVGTPEGADAQAFTLGAGTPSGAFQLPGMGSQQVAFVFQPTETRSYQATVKLRAGGACGESTVELRGEGVDTVLDWSPPSLDFLYVSPETSAVKQVTFHNYGSADVELFNVQTTLPSDFAVKAEPGQDPTKLVVPGNSEAKMNVVCRPSQLGARSAELKFQTPVAKQPAGVVALSCFGGGPDIEVAPAATLNFGKTAYFANAGLSVTRRVTVMNTGTAPPNGDPNGNLRLGKVSAAGVPGQLPLISVKPLNATTDASELSVGLPPSYDPAVGLEATAGKNLMDLTVTLTPKSLGDKEAELTIYSNDPDEPETKLLVTSQVVQLPPCSYSVSPAQVNFGLVTPGTSREVPVTFTNKGVNAGDTCLFSGIDLAPGTDPSYSVVGGAVPSIEVGPNQSFQVLVRVAPQGQVPASVVSLTGTLRYYASSPSAPSGSVPLTTEVGPSCLTIAPAHQDFGAVKPGCASPTRTFTLYNICSQTVTLSSISMQDGAGQPAGGPDCPGTSPCPEFFLTQTPAIPSGGLAIPAGGTPVNFQARYKALDTGKDSGVIAVNVIQTGMTVPYLVTLEGQGEANGQNTDVFTQDAQPKADVLFVIDDSCSMDPYQTSLSNNFASFIAYATSANVDWHIGVTTTDMDDAMPSPFPGLPGIPEGEKGRLIGDASNPKVLTPGTPNVAQKFQQKVQVGTDGSGTETGLAPTLAALTPPLSVAENAGFLRADANLAAIVVTDAPDQSNHSASYYVNSLLNIKGFNKANMFTFNAIAGFNPTPPAGCAGYDTGPDDGTYAAVVSQTQGIQEEICTQNWATALQGLGKTAFGFRTTFFLTSVPDTAQPITVTIDGVGIPQNGASGPNWSYDSVANAIVFDPSTAPGPGQNLTITYYVGCLP